MVLQLRATIVSADSVTPTFGRQYTMYTVKLHLFGGRSGAGDTWTVYRRYSAFSETDHKLYRLLLSAPETVKDAVDLPELPPKTLLVPRLDPEFVAKRREGLQAYLDNLLPSLQGMTPSMQNVVCEFLEVPIGVRPDLCSPSTAVSRQLPSSELSARSFGEQLHGPDSIDNSLHRVSPLPTPSGPRTEQQTKMTPDETARAKLEAFVEKLLQLNEAQEEANSPSDDIEDEDVKNDKVQIIRDFEYWFIQSKPHFREPSVQLLFVGFDPTGRTYVYGENPHPQYGNSAHPVGLLPEVGNFSENPPVSACAALGFLRKLLSFEYNSEAGIYTHVLKSFPMSVIQAMHLEGHIHLNRGQSSRLDAFQITRTIIPPGDRLLDLLNGDEWAVSEFSTWLKILGGGPAVSGMIGGPPGVLIQRRTHAPRNMKSSIHGRQNSLGGRQSIRRGTQVGGTGRGGLDVRKIAQDALLKVSTCVSTITYDEDGEEEEEGATDGSVNYYDSSTLPPTTESDNDSDTSFDQHSWRRVTPPKEFGETLRQPCNVRVDYHRLATVPPEHMARARLLHLPFHPEYVGALIYDHKAFIDSVLELDTQGTLPKPVRDKLLEFSYTHYNPLLHNVMTLSLPSRKHDMQMGDSAASPRSMTMAASVGSPVAGAGRISSVQDGPGTNYLTDLLDVVLNAPNSAPGFVKMQLLRAFKKLPTEDGGGYQIAYTSVDLSDELVSRGPGVPAGMWRGHVPLSSGPSPSVTLPVTPVSPNFDRSGAGGQTYLFSSTLDCRSANLSPCGMVIQPCGDDGNCCEVSAAAIFGMDSINLVSGDLLGEYIFFWPTLENLVYILQNVASLLPAYPYEFHHPFIEWIYTGLGPDSACSGEAGSPKRPRGQSASPGSPPDLGRFGGAGLDHPVELSMES
ncbi:hypothetical protein FOZ60_002784 [Perkinsus olseni]|uniref:PX domain-containing protein n=4 Tax=Perkinsus olseni TaxID=32597 RepID=A0A7J6NX48_PEROL|nr:hypothetical protein FOZ60_002784 [Perkinsus olseni]